MCTPVHRRRTGCRPGSSTTTPVARIRHSEASLRSTGCHQCCESVQLGPGAVQHRGEFLDDRFLGWIDVLPVLPVGGRNLVRHR
jgi:hypothetical protein